MNIQYHKVDVICNMMAEATGVPQEHYQCAFRRHSDWDIMGFLYGFVTKQPWWESFFWNGLHKTNASYEKQFDYTLMFPEPFIEALYEFLVSPENVKGL